MVKRNTTTLIHSEHRAQVTHTWCRAGRGGILPTRLVEGVAIMEHFGDNASHAKGSEPVASINGTRGKRGKVEPNHYMFLGEKKPACTVPSRQYNCMLPAKFVVVHARAMYGWMTIVDVNAPGRPRLPSYTLNYC